MMDNSKTDIFRDWEPPDDFPDWDDEVPDREEEPGDVF